MSLLTMNYENRPPLLGVYGVHYRWSSNTKEGHRSLALEDISFEITQGDITALLGPNGSGKSTLMKVIAGILPLQRSGCTGQVRYRGQDFLSRSASERAQTIGYVASDLNAEFPMTAWEVVLLGRTCQSKGFFYRPTSQDQDSVQWAMEQCLCWQLKNRALDTLSGGERQLVALARVLAQGPKILLLDEALSRMDLNHQVEMSNMLKNLTKKEGWSIFLVSHDVNLASEWADSAILLKEGKKISQGPIREVLTQNQIQSLYPGANLIVSKNPMTDAPQIFFGPRQSKRD